MTQYTFAADKKFQIESRKAEHSTVEGWITLSETCNFGGSVMMSVEDAKEVIAALEQAVLFRECGIEPEAMVECTASWDSEYKVGETYQCSTNAYGTWMWIHAKKGGGAIMGDIGENGVVTKNGSKHTTFKIV